MPFRGKPAAEQIEPCLPVLAYTEAIWKETSCSWKSKRWKGKIRSVGFLIKNEMIGTYLIISLVLGYTNNAVFILPSNATFRTPHFGVNIRERGKHCWFVLMPTLILYSISHCRKWINMCSIQLQETVNGCVWGGGEICLTKWWYVGYHNFQGKPSAQG